MPLLTFWSRWLNRWSLRDSEMSEGSRWIVQNSNSKVLDGFADGRLHCGWRMTRSRIQRDNKRGRRLMKIAEQYKRQFLAAAAECQDPPQYHTTEGKALRRYNQQDAAFREQLHRTIWDATERITMQRRFVLRTEWLKVWAAG